MARKKVRKYPTIENVQKTLNDYMDNHADEIIKYLAREMGVNNFDELKDLEFNTPKFWGDCGFVWLKARNPEQEHEWILDHGKYDAYVTRIKLPYQTQSIILKQTQIEKALDGTGLREMYQLYIMYD